MATPLALDVVKGLYDVGQTQTEIARQLGVSQKVIWAFMRRNGIKARVAAKRDQWGERNHKWKGANASYAAMHYRLKARFGKPQRCDQCGITDKRRVYDWANLTGKFDDIADYRRLCRSCHWKLDGKVQNLKGRKGVRS